MPRLRGSILPKKWRKKTSFSKPTNQNKSPSASDIGVDVVREVASHNSESESDPVVGTLSALAVPVFHAVNDWQQRQRLGRDGDRHKSPIDKNIILKVVNVLLTVYMMRTTLPSRWDVLYAGVAGKQTYFTPAPWSFFMWPLVHALMLGGCIYQFSYHGSSLFIEKVGWKLALLQVSNAMYIHCRNSLRYKYAFVFIIITYMMVNKIYRKTSKAPPRNIRDQLFCHLPFSLYHGWVLGLVFLAAFEAFGADATITPARSGTKISVLLSFMFTQLFEWAYASPANEGDIFACLAVSWFLFAITVEQSAVRSAFVHWSANGFTMFSLCWITKCMIGLELRDNGVFKEEECAPLLAS